VGGADDDVGDGGSDADLDAGVTLLGKLALEEFVEFGIEDTVWNCEGEISLRSRQARAHNKCRNRIVKRTSNELSPLGSGLSWSVFEFIHTL
jgi:hypothetical protein